jgi:DNA-binding MarR family transcriptional regulator
MHTDSPENDDCFAIRQAARHISQLYERYLSQADVTSSQFNILATIKRGSKLTMIELAQAMVMDRTTLVRALRPLQRNGLVANEANGNGVRRLELTLTENGQARLEEAMVYWRLARDEFQRQFGQQQAAALRDELFRLTREVSKD